VPPGRACGADSRRVCEAPARRQTSFCQNPNPFGWEWADRVLDFTAFFVEYYFPGSFEFFVKIDRGNNITQKIRCTQKNVFFVLNTDTRGRGAQKEARILLPPLFPLSSLESEGGGIFPPAPGGGGLHGEKPDQGGAPLRPPRSKEDPRMWSPLHCHRHGGSPQSPQFVT